MNTTNGWDGYEKEGSLVFKHHPGWKELIEKLRSKFSICSFLLFSEAAEKKYIKLLDSVFRTLNILLTFDEFAGKELIDFNGDFLDDCSSYNELHDKYRPRGGELTILTMTWYSRWN